jgi:hypothetical protein
VNHASEPSAFQRLSAPALLWLSSLPRWSLVVGLVVVLVAGLLLPGWAGAALLVLLALFLAWLAVLGASRLTPGAAALRALTVLLVLVAAARKVL